MRKGKKTGGPPRRILARLCALALIAVMLLTSAYAGGVIPPEGAEAAAEETFAYTVTINAKKILQDHNGATQPLSAGQFTFQLTQRNGTVVSTATNNAQGDIIFSIGYQEEELPKGSGRIQWDPNPTEYTYYISEQPGEDGSIHYDDTQYKVTVTLSQQRQVTISSPFVSYYYQTDSITYSVNNIPKDEVTFTNIIRDGGTVEPDPGASLGEPAHRKYIEANEDGTYQLSLDVTGKTKENQQITEHPVDIILVIDRSGSMKRQLDNDNDASQNDDSRMKIVQERANEMINQLLPSDQPHNNEMAIVSFSGSKSNNDEQWNDATTNQNWTSDAEALTGTVRSLSSDGGTNWEAGLRNANELLEQARPNAVTFVVFLSDGDPTYYYDSNGQTAGTGTQYDATAYTYALNEADKIDNSVRFYSIGVGPTNNNKKMEQFAQDLQNKGKSAKYFPGNDENALNNAFENITTEILTSGYTNVTISDTLSEYAEFVEVGADGTGITVTRTNKDGTIEPVPNSDYELTVNPDTKQVSIRWLKMLEDGVTYTISFTVKPSQKASDEYIQNGGAYPDDIVGEAGTGDTDGQPGFYSNTTATLTYNGDGNDQTINYSKPVIQIQTTTIPVEKIWDDQGNTAHRSDSITAELYYEESESPYRSITLDKTNNWQDQFANIPVGSEDKFIVKENMTDDQSSYYESTIRGDGTGFTITNTLKVASFTIKKVNESTKDPLEGARFELREAVVDGDTWSDQEHGKTYYPNNDENFLTSTDGKATFNDIPFGNYLLYETKAPAGYKLPKDPVRVTVEAGMVTLMNVNGETIGTVTPPTEGESTSQPDVTIPNKENDKLPVAGGAGTLWFTGGGLALAGAAALLYFKQRRKKGEE